MNLNIPVLAPATPPLSHGFGGDTVAMLLSARLPYGTVASLELKGTSRPERGKYLI